MNNAQNIRSAEGKLGVLLPGMGAIATTYIAGIMAMRKGIGEPIGSFTQMSKIRLGKRTENRNPDIKDFVPLASTDDLVFGGWDVFTDNTYQAAVNAGVLDKTLLDQFKDDMEAIKPMKAVFDKDFIQFLDGEHIKEAATKMELADALKIGRAHV